MTPACRFVLDAETHYSENTTPITDKAAGCAVC